ncbi:hypothetical protein LTR53_017275, partial [Teratosphaeriaceae sp. CCFEE 6253]
LSHAADASKRRVPRCACRRAHTPHHPRQGLLRPGEPRHQPKHAAAHRSLRADSTVERRARPRDALLAAIHPTAAIRAM